MPQVNRNRFSSASALLSTWSSDDITRGLRCHQAVEIAQKATLSRLKITELLKGMRILRTRCETNSISKSGYLCQSLLLPSEAVGVLITHSAIVAVGLWLPYAVRNSFNVCNMWPQSAIIPWYYCQTRQAFQRMLPETRRMQYQERVFMMLWRRAIGGFRSMQTWFPEETYSIRKPEILPRKFIVIRRVRNFYTYGFSVILFLPWCCSKFA